MEKLILKVCKGSYIESDYLKQKDVASVYSELDNFLIDNQPKNKGVSFLEDED